VYRQLAEDPDQSNPVTFHSIPDTGHCPHDERPEIVNALMLDWLKDL
jgi:pimeloyl-ACP methyl ester carboxylesterase